MKTDFYGRSSRALHYKETEYDLYETLNISTFKSYITQRHIKFYHSMRHGSSPLFSFVRAPSRSCWHHSRVIDINNQHTIHLHRWRLIWHPNSLLMQRPHTLCIKKFSTEMISRFLRFLFCYSSYNPTVGTVSHFYHTTLYLCMIFMLYYFL